MQVEAELDFMVEVLSHTPAERAGREHAAVPEDWEIEVRLAEPLLIQEVEVWAAGHAYEPTEAQRRWKPSFYTVSRLVVAPRGLLGRMAIP